MLDAALQFSNAQALSGAGAASTNVLALGAVRDVGAGEALGVLVHVDVAADTASGNETYEVQPQTDAADSFGSPAPVAAYPIDKALLVQGARFLLPLPANLNNEGFLRLNYALGGTTPSVTVSAWLVPLRAFPNLPRIYPAAQQIA